MGRAPPSGGTESELSKPGPKSVPQSLSLADFERELILRAIERAGGNQTEAAKALGIARNTLRRELEEYGLLA